MVRFGKKAASTPGDDWISTPAEILDIKYGLVHNTNTGVGGGYERSSANKTLSLRVEPTEDARSAVYPAATFENGAGGYSFAQGSGEAIPLEEYDFGSYNR